MAWKTVRTMVQEIEKKMDRKLVEKTDRKIDRKMKIALCYTVLFDNYTIALKEAGKRLGIAVEPVWFDCGNAITGMKPFHEFREEDFDGLLIPGGGDIDPSFYGKENCGSISPDMNTDRCQLEMLDAFVKAGKPILGICRGHQLINVYFGGTLCQDIPQKADHMRTKTGADNRHIINALPGSLAARLYGSSFPVNSAHHQAVDKTGHGIFVTARSEDGVAEALEHENLPIISVQFHPERMDYLNKREDTVAGGLIFEEFLQRTYSDLPPV